MAAGVPPPAGTRRAAGRDGAATAPGRARPRAVVPQRMRRAAAVAVLIVAAGRSVAAQGDADSLAARVHRLADAYVAGYFERHPDEATLDGVAGVRHDRLPDNSPITRGRWQAREDRWLAELRRIDPAPLAGRPEWTAYGVMRASHRTPSIRAARRAGRDRCVAAPPATGPRAPASARA